MKHLVAAAVFLLLFLPSPLHGLEILPYTGTVVDGETGQPIEGASVLVYWMREILKTDPAPYALPKLLEVRLVQTDSKGRYTIPIPSFILKPQNLVEAPLIIAEATNMVVYQPGYRFQRFQNAKIREFVGMWQKKEGFRHRDERIQLGRISPNFDHGRHYRDLKSALREIDDYSFMSFEDNIPWEQIVRQSLVGRPVKERFLQRAKWEERRSTPGWSQ